MNLTETKAVVIDADGHFGAIVTVWFSGTVEQCRRFAKRGNCQVIVGCERDKGEKILASSLADCINQGVWTRDE